MAVQGLLRGVQRSQTKAAARRTGAAHFRANAVDKALAYILTRCRKLGFGVIDGANGLCKHHAHGDHDGISVLFDRGGKTDHHRHHSGVHNGSLFRQHTGHGNDQHLHLRVCDVLVCGNGIADHIQHSYHRVPHGLRTVVKGVGKARNTGIAKVVRELLKLAKAFLSKSCTPFAKSTSAHT